MLRVLWNGRSSMIAQQEKLDAISNNIANSNTTGYKREEVSFQDLMYETLDRRGYPVNKGENKNLITGTGVKTGQWIRDNSQGSVVDTGAKTDLAIDGPGYFRVRGPEGDMLTRGGSFNIDANGNLVDKNGNLLVIRPYGNNGNVPLTKDNFSIKEDGVITVKQGNDYIEIGKIDIYNTTGDNDLLSVGENLYIPKEGVQPKLINSNIMQGFLENSNVDMAKEMSDMIITQRAFSFGSRAVTTADEMWGMVNNMRGK
ncbi:flagellar hook-basal body complex protein [Clostridium peptidivorans]|uniref:flagellar hook-basal body complex protein n=1 Tax=Clostridium peptidivorans TaxID=100174 RepID=UPI000BE37816|nr:flagellar hook-basal body complex protein [Clostridium peptidivorans]